MPTALNGEFSIQVFIVDCVGARHWSKPYPVKSPGVTRFSAWAGAVRAALATAALTVVTNRVRSEVLRDGRRTGVRRGRGLMVGLQPGRVRSP
jgi:hypothetical protein